MISHPNRRNFIKAAAMGTLAAISIPEIVSASFRAEKPGKKVSLQNGSTILFQGDSITDWGRNKNEKGFNNAGALGTGYAMLAAAELLEEHAAKSLKIYNKGVSGNKVYQLAERWENDTLALKPDVLSILIGVNDFWHFIDGKYKGTIEIYKKDYIALLERTKTSLPSVQLIICEPFALLGVSAVKDSWYPAFDEYRFAAREIARTFGAAFVPYQSIFDKALKTAPASYWTTDGVHASLAGAKLMAEAWLEAVK